MKMTVAQALVEIICKEGITTAFGIPGAAINPVYKYLEHAPIQHFTMRHEEACVHAADGYQRAKHEIALAICSAGPGATNFVTGLYTAFIDSMPVLCVVGQAAGLAAAMAVKGGTDIRHIDVKALQKAVYPLKEN